MGGFRSGQGHTDRLRVGKTGQFNLCSSLRGVSSCRETETCLHSASGQELPLILNSDHFTSLLKAVCWLPIRHKTKSKILARVYEALQCFRIGSRTPLGHWGNPRGLFRETHGNWGHWWCSAGEQPEVQRAVPHSPETPHVPDDFPAPTGRSYDRFTHQHKVFSPRFSWTATFEECNRERCTLFCLELY